MSQSGLTIYDISEQARVSAATVSRVLNGYRNIRKETRDRVQAVLDANSYTPNAFAQGLPTNTTRLVGIMAMDIRNYHHAEISFIIEQEFTKSGFASILCNTGTGREAQEKYLAIMAARKVQGLVLIGSIFQSGHIQSALEKYLPEVPVTLANGYLPLKNLRGVICGEREAECRCVQHLIDKGHRRIAFLKDVNTPSNREKQKGYLDALEKSGIAPDDALMARDIPETFEGGFNATREMLERQSDVTALVYTEDPAAIGGLKYAEQAGLKVPQDIEIVGFNNSALARMCSPTLTTVDNKRDSLGRTAARLLHDMLDGRDPPKKTMLQADIVFRESSPEGRSPEGHSATRSET